MEQSSKLPRIIGITGTTGQQKQVGKDVLGSELHRAFGYQRLQFAAPLKRMLGAMLQEDPALYEDEEHKAKPLVIRGWQTTRRKLLQRFGTEIGRSIRPTIWVDLAREKIETASHVRWVLTDVRFDNEAEMIRDMGGIVISLFRPDTYPRGDEFIKHPSEKGVHPALIDLIITNSQATEAEFREHARKEIVNFIGRKEAQESELITGTGTSAHPRGILNPTP